MDPVVLVVTADAREGERLLDELGRYRRDYQIEVVSSAAEATARLAEVDAAAGLVAMVLAEFVLAASDGVELLANVRAVTPTTRCVLLRRPRRGRGRRQLGWSGRPTPGAVRRPRHPGGPRRVVVEHTLRTGASGLSNNLVVDVGGGGRLHGLQHVTELN